MLSGLLLVLALTLAPINGNVFWYKDGVIEVKQNTEYRFAAMTTEPSYSNTVLAYLYCKVEFVGDEIHIYRDGLLMKTFKIKEVLFDNRGG